MRRPAVTKPNLTSAFVEKSRRLRNQAGAWSYVAPRVFRGHAGILAPLRKEPEMPDDLDELRPRTVIRERDLARRWRKSVRSLQRLRRGKGGPRWLRIGATVYYRAEDIFEFESAHTNGGPDE